MAMPKIIEQEELNRKREKLMHDALDLIREMPQQRINDFVLKVCGALWCVCVCVCVCACAYVCACACVCVSERDRERGFTLQGLKKK